LEYVINNFGGFLLSFDGDLDEVRDKQIKLLLDPLSDQNVHMTIGSVCGAMSSLSGQRGFKINSISGILDDKRYSLLRSEAGKDQVKIGYGLEVLLNYHVSGSVDPDFANLKFPIKFVDTDFMCKIGVSESKYKNKLKAPREVKFMMDFLASL
jgi:hypothetical protein